MAMGPLQSLVALRTKAGFVSVVTTVGFMRLPMQASGIKIRSMVTASRCASKGGWFHHSTSLCFLRYVHIDGTTYEGEWHSDEKSGRGVETWSDGARYEGEFLHGSKHGGLALPGFLAFLTRCWCLQVRHRSAVRRTVPQ